MDYGKLFSRSWNIIWRHKFLILIGVLVALGSGVGSGMSSSSGSALSQNGQGPAFQMPGIGPFGEPGGLFDVGVPLGPVVILGTLGLGLVLVLWVVSTIARGSLIAGAAAADASDTPSLGQAWSAGWHRAWTLLGIGVLPAIPGLILLLGGVGSYLFAAGTLNEAGSPAMNVSLGLLGALGCIMVPLIFVLGLLRTFANRACMLEGVGVLESYATGFRVLMRNFGPALILFLLQVAVSIILGIVLFVPGVILALCCVFWPVLLLFEGTMAAFFSTLWTLAWREWTGVPSPAL
jgi:hypothetical protein